MMLKHLLLVGTVVAALTHTSTMAAAQENGDVNCADLPDCGACSSQPTCSWCGDAGVCQEFTQSCSLGLPTNNCDNPYSYCLSPTLNTRQTCDNCVGVPGHDNEKCVWIVDTNGDGKCGGSDLYPRAVTLAREPAQCAAPVSVCGTAAKNADCATCVAYDADSLVQCAYCKSAGMCINLFEASESDDGTSMCPATNGQPLEPVVLMPELCNIAPGDDNHNGGDDTSGGDDNHNGGDDNIGDAGGDDGGHSDTNGCLPCLQKHCRKEMFDLQTTGSKSALGTCALSSCDTPCANSATLSPANKKCLLCVVGHCADVDQSDTTANLKCVADNCISSGNAPMSDDCLAPLMKDKATYGGLHHAPACLRCTMKKCLQQQDKETCIKSKCESPCKAMYYEILARTEAGHTRQSEYASNCKKSPQLCTEDDDAQPSPATIAARQNAGCCKLLDQPTCESTLDTTSGVRDSPDDKFTYSRCMWAGTYHECVPTSATCDSSSDSDHASVVGITVAILLILAVIGGSIVACIKCGCNCCPAKPSPQHIANMAMPQSVNAPYVEPTMTAPSTTPGLV